MVRKFLLNGNFGTAMGSFFEFGKKICCGFVNCKSAIVKMVRWDLSICGEVMRWSGDWKNDNTSILDTFGYNDFFGSDFFKAVHQESQMVKTPSLQCHN